MISVQSQPLVKLHALLYQYIENEARDAAGVL